MQGIQLVFCGGDSLREVVQRIIQTNDVAQRVGAQRHRVLPLPLQNRLILAAKGIEPQGQFKAPVAANHFFLGVGQLRTGKYQTLTGGLFLIVGNTLDGHAAKLLLALRVGGGKLCVRFHPSNIGVRFLNVSREFGQQLVLQAEFLTLVVGFQHLQLGDLNVQVHLLLDKRISGTQRLDLRIRQCLFVHIIAGTHRRFRSHNLADESLFILKGLEEVAVKCPFRDVIEHLDFLVHVALPDDATIALGHITGFPADIQMMHCHKPGLDVGARSHFRCTSEQNSHIAGAHFGEQCCLFCFGVGVVDELNLVFRHTGGNQLLANVIVHVKVAVVFRRREVAEQKLGQLLVFAFLPDLQHVLNAYVQLAVGVIRQHGVHQANVQANLAPIVGDAEHIVLGGIHSAGMDAGGTFAQFLHHFLLNLRGFCHHGFKLCFWHRQMELVGCFNVRNLLEHGHQFRQIEKLCESRPRPIPSTFGG